MYPISYSSGITQVVEIMPHIRQVVTCSNLSKTLVLMSCVSILDIDYVELEWLRPPQVDD